MMTFGGVPILDWVLLVVMLGFGVEAYLTTRRTDKGDPDAAVSEPAMRSPDTAPSQTRRGDS